MTETYQSNEEIQALIESCGPDEICMMFGSQGFHKMPRATWGHMYLDACVEAARRAMQDAGAEHSITRTPSGGWQIKAPGTTGLFLDGDDLYHLDMSESTVTARVRAANGREGTGVVFLDPPKRVN